MKKMSMDVLTASQRIAHSSMSLNLKDLLVPFDEFALDVVAEAAEDVALMVNARFSTKSSRIRETRRLLRLRNKFDS